MNEWKSANLFIFYTKENILRRMILYYGLAIKTKAAYAALVFIFFFVTLYSNVL